MIKRYFKGKKFGSIKSDFAFLTELIKHSNGELDFAIRDDYFNLYYKGNSLAKVRFKDDKYEISIHTEFFSGSKAQQDNRFVYQPPKGIKNPRDYYTVLLEKNSLHPFFQKIYLDDFCSKIRKRNYGEEIVFEQTLITDNLNRQDFIFIDRQITDDKLKRQRMDLLALNQIEKDTNIYQFIVCEVKLGNNPELKDKVASQLNGYLTHIENNFTDYKECYEMQYQQKKELGLFNYPNFKNIEIVKPIEGLIIVGGYSGIARDPISDLKKNYPKLKVLHCINEIDFKKVI